MPLARIASLVALLVLSFLPASVRAQAQAEWIAALRGGGHVIVFRHGATNNDQADTDPFNLDNTAAQRQLNEAGRNKAKEIGDVFRKFGIPVGEVMTSKLYRAIETGKLMFPSLTPMPTIDLVETSLISSPNENARRIAALRKLASTVPPAGRNLVVVTHRPNVLDAFGKDWFDVSEGEASIFKPDGTAFKSVARLKADEWSKLAQ